MSDETRKNEVQPEIKDLPEKPTISDQENEVKGGIATTYAPVDIADAAKKSAALRGGLA